MEIVSTQPVPSQEFSVSLNNQPCQIKLYQLRPGLFIDLYINDELIIGGVICQNLNRIVRSLYLGFQGDLIFIDSEGSGDPKYSGLGSRYNLAYLYPDELPAGQG